MCKGQRWHVHAEEQSDTSSGMDTEGQKICIAGDAPFQSSSSHATGVKREDCVVQHYTVMGL